jgi:hypothetical protein
MKYMEDLSEPIPIDGDKDDKLSNNSEERSSSRNNGKDFINIDKVIASANSKIVEIWEADVKSSNDILRRERESYKILDAITEVV